MAISGHQEREHKKFSPSGAERRRLCPGSVKQIERTPPADRTSYSEEGTKAHEILETGLLFECESASEAINNSIYCAETFSPEFKASITDALDYIYNIRDDLDLLYGDVQIFVERYVDTPSSVAKGEAGGPCDVIIYSAIGRVLYVIDYKHGAGVAKEATDNLQCFQYAGGALYEDNPVIDPLSVDQVILVIIQPRAFHPRGPVREYETTPAAVCDYLMVMDSDIERCLDPRAELVPGDVQCQFCPAFTTCPAVDRTISSALVAQATQITQVLEGEILEPPQHDVHRIAFINIIAIPMMKRFISKHQEYAKSLLHAGHEIPGLKLVEVDARREWYRPNNKTDEDIARELAAVIGCPLDEVVKPKLINITDADKLITRAFKGRVSRNKKKSAAEDAMRTFAMFTDKKTSGNLTVAPSDDPRPAINKAERAFGSIEGLTPPPERN